MGVEIKELDVVALLIDLPEQGLRCGDVGTVVHVVEANEQHSVFFIVEFHDKETDDWILADISDSSRLKLLRSMSSK